MAPIRGGLGTTATTRAKYRGAALDIIPTSPVLTIRSTRSPPRPAREGVHVPYSFYAAGGAAVDPLCSSCLLATR